jgi:hypothetical protein
MNALVVFTAREQMKKRRCESTTHIRNDVINASMVKLIEARRNLTWKQNMLSLSLSLSLYIYIYIYIYMGHAVAKWLRRQATSRKVASSRPYGEKFKICPILPAALGPGVYSASN